MRIKKFLTFLLTLAMVVSLLPGTAFAANNTATTMRLAKTQGTVAVTSVTGKKVTQTSNMKLYNGYKLKTGAKSYAWISLDDTKVAKLDANSVVSVQKSGQKLTLYLSSGNLFFNVKDPLKSGESFHIKTSTMTTGIRGTSGCVRVISDRVTEIHLLTGRVEVHTENPAVGVSKTAVLTAGQKAFSLIAEDAVAATGKQAEILIKRLDGSEVCGSCSKEIAEDPALIERIEAEAPHLLPDEIVAEADERLAADEQAAEEKQAAIEEAVAKQEFPEDVDPYFEETSSGGGGGGSSSGSVETDVIEVANWQQFVTALNTFNGGSTDKEIRLIDNITADDGETAESVVQDNGAELTLNLQEYSLTLPASLVNEGEMTIKNVDGSIKAADDWTGDYYLIVNSGTLHHIAGEIIAPASGVAVRNTGNFEMNGTGTITVPAGATNAVGIYNRGTLDMAKGIVNALAGVGVNLNAGDVAFGSDARVFAKDTAKAVVWDKDAVSLARPVAATISWTYTQADYSPAPDDATCMSHMFDPAPDYADVAPEEAMTPEGLVLKSFEDNYGHVEDADMLVEMIKAFNNGAADMTITLDQDIDTTGYSETLPAIANNGKTLTFDLKSYKLTLKDSLTVNNGANLKIAGSGGAVNGTADVLITNNGGNLTLDSGTLNIARAAATDGIGVQNNGGTVDLTGMRIAVREDFGTGIYSNGGTVTINGSAIDVGVKENGTVYGNAATGIHAENAADVTMTFGTVNAVSGGLSGEPEDPSSPIPLYTSNGIIIGSGCTLLVAEEEDSTYEAKILVTGNSTTGIMNYGTTTLETGCYILASASDGTVYGIENEGTLNMRAGDIYVNAVANTKAVAVISAGTMTMTGGTITAGSDSEGVSPTNLVAVDTRDVLRLRGGTITANENATAIMAFNEGIVTFGASKVTTVRAKTEDTVFDGELPPDMLISDEADSDGYYVLISLNETPPAQPDTPDVDDTVEVNAGEFVQELMSYDGSTDKKIILKENDGITDETMAAAGATAAQIEVSSGSGTLTIDLAGQNLAVNAAALVNKGNLIIMDSVGGGTITGATAALIENQSGATLDLQGGTITISESTTYRAVENVGSMEMSGGKIDVQKGTGISLQSGTLTLKGGTIEVSGGEGIYANTSNDLSLESGTILVKTADATGISVSDVGKLTLTSALVKGVDKEKLLVGYYKTAYTVDGPDGDNYYTLTEVSDTSADEQAALQTFAEQLIVYNVNGGETEIKLTADVTFDRDFLKEMDAYDTLAELGYPYEYLAAYTMGDQGTLTIDLAGHSLILNTTLENYVDLIITDSVGGGKVTGTAATLIYNSGTITLKDVEMEVSDGVTKGIESSGGTVNITNGTTVTNNSAGGTAIYGGTITMDSSTLTVNGGTGLRSASAAHNADSEEQIANITLYNGSIEVKDGVGVYLNPGRVSIEGTNINVSSGTGILNKNTDDYMAIADMESGSITVGKDSVGVDGGTLHMSGGEIRVTESGGVGVWVEYLDMNGGEINAAVNGAIGIYATGKNTEIYLYPEENGTSTPFVFADADSNGTWTATAIKADYSIDDNGAVTPLISIYEAGIVQAVVEDGLINKQYLTDTGLFEVMSPDENLSYWTLSPVQQ